MRSSMVGKRRLAIWLVLSLLAHALCIPTDINNLKRFIKSKADSEISRTFLNNLPGHPIQNNNNEEIMKMSPSINIGTNFLRIINLVNTFFPESNGANVLVRNVIKEFLTGNQASLFARRQDTNDNEIEIDYNSELKPPFEQQESDEKDGGKRTESDSVANSSNSQIDEFEEDNAAEESVEEGNGNASKQDSDSNTASNGNDDDDSDSDSDEPPGGGDGQGGGILGLLAGLSGGEDGQSDLGSLLATISGIVANLSGDGIDLNSLIASGIGLFVGLLSEGEENPGAVIASYLLTSLDTLTGGGSKNNGAFFGTFISKLVKGTSAAGDPDVDSEENGNGNGMKMTDSAGFFFSFLISLLGDMSKGSSGGSSNPW